MKNRTAKKERKTKETTVTAEINLDGAGEGTIDTGVGFLDHMLALLSKHSLIDMKITAKGDKEVDDHHSVEDVGITLGAAIKEALGSKKQIVRFGQACVPMDEVLASVVLDISDRPFVVFNADFKADKVGEYDVELTGEFLRAFATNAGINLHVNVPYGDNGHHINEAIFKALATALYRAVQIDPRKKGVPSTKGTL